MMIIDFKKKKKEKKQFRIIMNSILQVMNRYMFVVESVES